MKEIYNRGPISCGIDANPLLKYTTGIIKGFGLMDDHVVSVVGWGTDPEEGPQVEADGEIQLSHVLNTRVDEGWEGAIPTTNSCGYPPS